LGQLDDVAPYFCLEMGSGLYGVSARRRLNLKFANQLGVGDEVRIFPALWDSEKIPPDIVQGPL
jgi:hypothetical protein